MKLQGIFADTATPFDYAGQLYRLKIQHNVEKWLHTTLPGLLLAGPAGEGQLLSSTERIQLWETAKGAAPASSGSRIFLAGISAGSVVESAALCAEAARFGYDAAVVEAPDYPLSGVPPELLAVQYYRALADRSKLPLILSLPAKTRIPDDFLARTAEHPNVTAVLDPSPDGSKVASLRKVLPAACSLLIGSERVLWQGFQAGASGAVLPFASAAPYAAIAFWEAFRTREEEAAQDWQARIALPAGLISDRAGVPGLKIAMDRNGYYGGPPRLPSILPGAEISEEIIAALGGLSG